MNYSHFELEKLYKKPYENQTNNNGLLVKIKDFTFYLFSLQDKT